MSKWHDPDFNPYCDEEYLISVCDNIASMVWLKAESININEFIAPGYEANLLLVAEKYSRSKTVKAVLYQFNVPAGLTFKEQIAWITMMRD